MRTRLLLLALVLVGGSTVASAQVTVSSTQTGQNDNTGGTAGTIAAVNVTAGETLMVVSWNRQNAAQVTTTATHGASALSALASATNQVTGSSGINVTVFCTTGLSGSQTVTVNYSATTLWHLYAIRLAGAAASTPCGTAGLGGANAGTAVSATVSSVVNGLVVSSGLLRTTPVASFTVDSPQVLLASLANPPTASYTSAASTEAGAASVTSGWTWTGTIENAVVVVPVAPAAGGGGGVLVPNCLLLGVCD